MPKLDKEKIKSQKIGAIIVFLLFFTIVLLWFCFLVSNRFGKIGYEKASSTSINPEVPIIKLTDNDLNSEKKSDLNIFSNPEFDGKKMIAPHSQSTYDFNIENSSNSNLRYSIFMEEVNRKKINMKYKLKMDNLYIVGDEQNWANVNDLNIQDIVVPAGSKNFYTLEWYWEDAKGDTKIGRSIYAEYKLNICVVAQNI